MEEEILKKVSDAKVVAESNNCCRHSNFTVGAILVTKDNKEYKGFNVENKGINSICAERVAFVKALTDGITKDEFAYIVVVGKDINARIYKETLPCGYCREFMSEYVNKDFKIYTYDDEKKEIYAYTLEDLLPHSFEF